ncbi:hypothetical protein CDL12_26374 [Handroanthus impetiginosus]|uniref:AP2/ERF domain-containing protein n=1 Tax=Handroanthus impetiginosus TaxID=429701 RepID=A0A2G9G819_9LAMI|nr:hypothetical protein CDL12_26374 [Handroanthus impetiginosus]
MGQQRRPPPPRQKPCTSFPPPSPPPMKADQLPHFQPSYGTELSLPSPKKVKKPTKMSSTACGGAKPSRATSRKHAIYRGIRCRGGKWVSEIREPRKTRRIWLGTYPSPEMAAAAYDSAALALKGGDAVLNFPDLVSSYPKLSFPSPLDIRRAAASAAEMMRPDGGGADNDQLGNDEMAEAYEEIVSNGSEFIDEEALFHMPNLLKDMAEGMLVSPPRMASPSWDEIPGNYGESLWSY